MHRQRAEWVSKCARGKVLACLASGLALWASNNDVRFAPDLGLKSDDDATSAECHNPTSVRERGESPSVTPSSGGVRRRHRSVLRWRSHGDQRSAKAVGGDGEARRHVIATPVSRLRCRCSPSVCRAFRPPNSRGSYWRRRRCRTTRSRPGRQSRRWCRRKPAHGRAATRRAGAAWDGCYRSATVTFVLTEFAMKQFSCAA
jgi:hypothetical protein